MLLYGELLAKCTVQNHDTRDESELECYVTLRYDFPKFMNVEVEHASHAGSKSAVYALVRYVARIFDICT